MHRFVSAFVLSGLAILLVSGTPLVTSVQAGEVSDGGATPTSDGAESLSPMMLGILTEIAQLERDSEIAQLEIQLEYARLEGDTDAVGILIDEIQKLKKPPRRDVLRVITKPTTTGN